MNFEIFVYRAQVFAAKMQAHIQGPPAFWKPYAVGLGGIITQFLMSICFARTLAEGEKQWQKQKSAKSATKKSEPAKKPVPSAEPISRS
jgi:hypothetical protein